MGDRHCEDTTNKTCRGVVASRPEKIRDVAVQYDVVQFGSAGSPADDQLEAGTRLRTCEWAEMADARCLLVATLIGVGV